MDLSNHKTIWI